MRLGLYLTFLYGFMIPFGRVSVDELRSRGWLVNTLVALGLLMAAWLCFIAGKAWKQTLPTIVVLSVIGASVIQTPEEMIHFFQYGGLVFFVMPVLEKRKLPEKRLLPLGFLICVLFGLIDELLQAITPQRYFDWRDVAYNTLGTGMGFALRKSLQLVPKR